MNRQLDLLKPKTAPGISQPSQLSAPLMTKRSSIQTLSVDYPRSFSGLDAVFCPNCERSIAVGTTEYNELRRKQS